MELRTLQYFLTIAREESISRAAEYLHMTQPTLSRQMKDLEEQLGKTLFVRGKRRITLTDDGILLKNRAEEIVGLVERTEAEVMANEEVLTGDIYIGAGESEGLRIIARVINKIQKRHSQVKFHLFSGKAEDVTEKIDLGLLDFGIIIEPVDLNKYDYLKLNFQDTWGVLMRKDNHLASLEKITPEDLRGKPLLCSNQAMVKNEIAGWIGGNQRKFNIVGTYNLLFNASLIVEESDCYALCLDKIINTSGNSQLCFRPLVPELKANVIIIWKKYKVFSKTSEVFLKKVQEEISKQQL
ncbi:LysR family transcriptional regulator [Clostridium intestinale]|uniref:LysR family transcriptional regulator n=1 Tax=Clostridium intestinale TaxID=36845 RepID=UPI0028EB5111|nr:LysR family transcriptional regulator [Clostridium intestinale]